MELHLSSTTQDRSSRYKNAAKFSQQLRSGTAEAHRRTESSPYFCNFMRGEINLEQHKELIANLYAIYGTLESELRRHRGKPYIQPIYHTALNRKASLGEDLSYFYGDSWHSVINQSDAADAYVDRILCISMNQPVLLIAHAYVRYLGDLSGGQIIKKILRASLNLPHNLGTKFHDFDFLPTKEARITFKDNYRRALDSLKIDLETKNQIIQEANLAFSLNFDLLH